MRTRHVWLMTLANLLAVAVGQAAAQTPGTYQPYAAASRRPVVAQAGYDEACGACAGAGCGICGAAPVMDFASGGCDGCGGGCNSCGPMSGGGMFNGGPMGGLGGAGNVMHQIQNHLDNSHYGGYSTQHLGQQNGPFGGAGCCTPMWHDVHVEWMYLSREKIGDNIDITSRGVSGPIALSTDDLSFDEASGFRATYALLVGPGTNVEASYFGTNHWSDSATVTGNGDLYSVFSNYGTQPVDNTQAPPVIGFPQTVDAADLHSISYSSDLNNGEINLRHRWVSANCLLHGSYLAGVRYIALDEKFNHHTQVADGGFLDYEVSTQNDMIGFQIGGDLFVCISPRFKLGGEIEAGIYGNRTTSDTIVNTREVNGGTVTDNAPALAEDERGTDAAFGGEAGVIGIFKISPRFSVRGGYQMIYLDGVALAAENFNTQSPFSTRQPLLDNNGNVFYHGATLGFEWTW